MTMVSHFHHDDPLPVSVIGSEVIHVIDLSQNPGWVQGQEAQTVCNRKLEVWIVDSVNDRHRPCRMCDRKTSVMAATFKVDQVIKRQKGEAADEDKGEVWEVELSSDLLDAAQEMFEAWLRFGVAAGYISPPVCLMHHDIPLVHGEAEYDESYFEEHGEYPCKYVVRLMVQP